MSDRRKRLHQLLLTLINKDDEFKLMEDDSTEITKGYTERDNTNYPKIIEKNRKILKKYHSLVRTAITLDALMDSENDENFKIN